jgi:hypothetical protein
MTRNRVALAVVAVVILLVGLWVLAPVTLDTLTSLGQ